MAQIDIADLLKSFDNRLKATTDTFYRYIYKEIDWDDRLIGLKGPRGCGKTTLLLQHIKEAFPSRAGVLYVSLDNLWFMRNNLLDLVDYHYSHGGTHLFIDEVHKYPNWQVILKNIYDDFPYLHVVYTGSSMLEIDHAQGDLSRRQIVYNMTGMSLREFLEYENILKLPPVTLTDLLENHIQIASEITDKVKILPIFEAYLKHGYYPFYREVKRGYEQRLQEVIRQILESDYPAIDEVTIATIRKTQKMLMILAQSVPQVPTMSDLYRELETDRNQGLKMLYALERAGLLSLLTSETKSVKTMSRPDKIYLNNTNLMYALCIKSDIGTERETFFFNQLSHNHAVTYPKQGDFLVDKKLLFEVGGKHKSFDQIKDIADSYLAIDDIEVGYGNKIPLWTFGLLY